jgi:hypothetical protein
MSDHPGLIPGGWMSDGYVPNAGGRTSDGYVPNAGGRAWMIARAVFSVALSGVTMAHWQAKDASESLLVSRMRVANSHSRFVSSTRRVLAISISLSAASGSS